MKPIFEVPLLLIAFLAVFAAVFVFVVGLCHVTSKVRDLVKDKLTVSQQILNRSEIRVVRSPTDTDKPKLLANFDGIDGHGAILRRKPNGDYEFIKLWEVADE
jgi:hypothetical protein